MADAGLHLGNPSEAWISSGIDDMSYCHDIFLDMDFDSAAFAAVVGDIRTLIRRSEIEIVGPSARPNSLPIAEENRVAFNGVNLKYVAQLNVRSARDALVNVYPITGGEAIRASRSLLTSARMPICAAPRSTNTGLTARRSQAL